MPASTTNTPCNKDHIHKAHVFNTVKLKRN